MVTATSTCTGACSGATQVGTVYPASFDSLDPGDIATFEWIYTIQGDTAGDFVTFTAGLLNGIDTVQAVATLQPVPVAENADVALESGGVVDDAAINESILLFHKETELVPSPGYQMMSSDSDGGSSGLEISMETQLAANPISFFTNNGTSAISVPAGKWNASLAIRSAPLPFDVSGDPIGMIFHMEDGAGVNPDNSEGDSSRDLTECGLLTFNELIGHQNDDAEERSSGTVDLGTSSIDHELIYETPGFQHVGLRWELDIPKDAIIQSAYIDFDSRIASSGSVDLIIGAEDVDDAGQFTTTNSDISDRWASVTTEKVVWDNIPSWFANEDSDDGTDTRTPDLKDIVQEMVERSDWDSGDGIVFIFKDNGGLTGHRTAKHFDTSGYPGVDPTDAARLIVVYGTTGTPSWDSNEGPHGSGAYYYDGVSMCHRSTNNVSTGDHNLPSWWDSTTSLWFKTEFVDQVDKEQMLFFMDWDNQYPNADYYKIAIGSEGDGRILFEYDGDNGNKPVPCLSVNEYDDGDWHMVTAMKDQSADRCWLYIHDIDGVEEEVVDNDVFWSGNHDVGAFGTWHLGTMNERAYYFNGYIDDVMHWNYDYLSTDEVAELAITNYGLGAHQLDVSMNITDTNGSIVDNIYIEKAIPIPFQDPKGYSETNDDAYTLFNVTMNIPTITNFTIGQRLNYSMNFVPGSATWEPLDMNIDIDDTGYTDPYPSYLQIPMPDNPFQSYIVYDRTLPLEFFLENSGADGVYFVYPGTRAIFDDGFGNSYASYIKWVNGTGTEWDVDENEDSIYIPTGEVAWMHFWENPTDRPCKASGVCNSAGTIIPAGTYRVAIWVNGYSDQGETFGRSVVLGVITVTAP